MRFRHPDGSTVHLAYCTNVHPAETLDGVLAQLRDHCEPVRRRLGRDRLGIGLWLARDAARALTADPAALRRLRAELDTRGLEVVTLNGFPYRGIRRPARQVPRLPPRLDGAGPAGAHHRPGAAADLAAPRRRGRGHHLDPAARLAHRLRSGPPRPRPARHRPRRAAHPHHPAGRPGGPHRPLHPGRPGARAGLHRRDHRRRHRPAHRPAPERRRPGRPPHRPPHRHLRRHLPPRHLLRGTTRRAGRAAARRGVHRQVAALRRAARRAPRTCRRPRRARGVRRAPLPPPDPHPHPAGRTTGHRRPRRGARRRERAAHHRPLARPTSMCRCTPRPSRRSPPPCRSSRTPSRCWSAGRSRVRITWRSRRTPGRRCRPRCVHAPEAG